MPSIARNGLVIDYSDDGAGPTGDSDRDSSPPERRQAVASQLPPNRHEWDAEAPAITAERFAGILARGMTCEAWRHDSFCARLRTCWPRHSRGGSATTLPSAGHMGPLTHSAVVNECIKTFLAKQRK